MPGHDEVDGDGGRGTLAGIVTSAPTTQVGPSGPRTESDGTPVMVTFPAVPGTLATTIPV